MPPALARRSSSKTVSGSPLKCFPAPSRSASVARSCRSSGTPVGGSSALRRRMTRPSRLVIVPSSSAHMALGRTTSASSAVSERKKSLTARKSRSPSRLMTRRASGALTATLRREHEEGADAAVGAERVEQLERRPPGHRQVVGVDPPDGGDVGAGGRVLQRAVAGQLVGLLPVLAAALPVALAGDRAPAAAGPAGQPERERQVDPRLGGVGAAAVLLGAAGGEDDRLLRAGQGEDGAPLVGDGHAGEPLDPVGPVARRRPARTSSKPVVRAAT